MARSAGILALIAVSLFVVLARPITRPTGRLNRTHSFTGWSLLAEAGVDDHAPLASPASSATMVIVFALAAVPRSVLKRTQQAVPSIPFRRRKIPPPRGGDSISPH